ncbi:hypothetical protein ABB37_02099 [Leptomonas pyrrhocoris]|uniref:Uncharacterized protein n=1 Tax=Leptomonas pyrrhocoris TaxID=157538 RepID=A0A0M9G7H6_LEPPY|nr:hypothetical protein ABB37_02099 [Leptomonas pyrrhocoris]KPA83946.1 hypothetical protein ABB37_02099 [Leptomonas pyrrhocoris]|eukprot:XP_015662385.1 hypothetical protein ABB37_02099 [Leptomonas pyrrhocoris]
MHFEFFFFHALRHTAPSFTFSFAFFFVLFSYAAYTWTHDQSTLVSPNYTAHSQRTAFTSFFFFFLARDQSTTGLLDTKPPPCCEPLVHLGDGVERVCLFRPSSPPYTALTVLIIKRSHRSNTTYNPIQRIFQLTSEIFPIQSSFCVFSLF